MSTMIMRSWHIILSYASFGENLLTEEQYVIEQTNEKIKRMLG